MRWLTGRPSAAIVEPVPAAAAPAADRPVEERRGAAPTTEPDLRVARHEAQPARPDAGPPPPPDAAVRPSLTPDRGGALRLRHVDRV
jgi:hypothetical protein